MSMRSAHYQGQGPEIVWVGPGSEVGALGYESDKAQFLRTGRFDVVSMGLRLGFLAPVLDSSGAPQGVREVFSATSQDAPREISLTDAKALNALQERWTAYLDAHTGVRSIPPGELEWSPQDFSTSSDLSTKLPEKVIELLRKIGLRVDLGAELSPADVQRLRTSCSNQSVWSDLFSQGKIFEATVAGAQHDIFPFKLDLGAPLPTGWRQSLLGLSKKEVLGLNPALLLAHEVVYRALLNACLHPAQQSLAEMFPLDQVGLYLGSGIGPHEEHQQMIVDTLQGRPAGAKALANCIANIACGYLSGRLGIKGKISTHVGACESCLGAIADAYHDLKSGRVAAALAGGFEDAMTASSYNGFTSNLAFTTNDKLLENVGEMVEQGIVTEPQVKAVIQERRKRVEDLEGELKLLEEQYAKNALDYYDFQKKTRELKRQKRLALLALPKCVARFASMPFAKYRSGFVMGIGGGAGFFTTLDAAIRNGLPIRAYLAGVAEMIPDSDEEGASIAALGDGVGDAYERAFLEVRKNYRSPKGGDLSIDEIGAWFAHGTSTPLNGWGERREIERVNRKYGRSGEKPILITGDKAESGHRIAGNFPSLVGAIFEHNEILPVGNYLQAGFSPKGRKGFGDPLDELFPTTKVVGRAGVGQGKPVPYEGDFVAVNGAGFGRINTVLLFRRFRLSEVSGAGGYDSKVKTLESAREALRRRILFGQEPLIR